MSRKLTLGSLFDGIGGFPLAGKKAGIVPVWASEIEPFPVRVTEKRLPEMKHYGDVHGLNGADLEPVDIITFGSPCQDLSIAGKRTGLGGSRSSLFYEAVRVITEMRESTNGKYPRWAVWENVPGALSSQDGQDFRCVLESLIRIKDPKADVPVPENGRWLPAGEILGDGYSLAWRVLDAAQGWGVAQRRKRIFAVLDLDGQCAGKVLFESEGLSGYTPPGGEARQRAARGSQDSAGAAGERVSAAGFCREHSADSRGIGYEKERAPTLRAGVVPGVAIDFNPTDSRIRISEDGVCQTLCSRMGTGGNQVPLVFGLSSDQSRAMLSANPHAGVYEALTSRTLDTSGSSPQCHQGGMLVVAPAESPCYCLQGSMIGRKEENGPQGDGINREVAFTLDTSDRHAVYAMTTGSFTQVDQEKSPPLMARDYKDPPLVGRDEQSSEPEGAAYAMDRSCFSAGQNAQYSMNIGREKVPTLTAQGPGAVTAPETGYVVRRLTPRECCRLQGYPDGWTEQLGTERPTDEEIRYWAGVIGEWYRASGKTAKAPSRNRIVKWLRDPRTDSAEYKAYGNSVCVYCVFFVLAGIVWAEEMEENAN